MNAELKKHLEDTIAALIDGNTEAATKALHEYFPKKARALIVGESDDSDEEVMDKDDDKDAVKKHDDEDVDTDDDDDDDDVDADDEDLENNEDDKDSDKQKNKK